MTDICRLCASLKRLGVLIPLSDPSQAVKKKLRRCCQLELPANDEFMPQSVCNDCVGQLNACWSFAERVEQVQETLRQAFVDDFVDERSDVQTEPPPPSPAKVDAPLPAAVVAPQQQQQPPPKNELFQPIVKNPTPQQVFFFNLTHL